MRKYYINTILDVFGYGAKDQPQTCVLAPSGREVWVRAVPEPYTAGSIFAAWEVLCGRAFAFKWPEPGDLEKAAGNFPILPISQISTGPAGPQAVGSIEKSLGINSKEQAFDMARVLPRG